MKYHQDINISYNYSVMLRPPMWLGIPYDILPILGGIEILFYIGFNPIYGFAVLPFLWVLGFSLGKYDPDFGGVIKNRGHFIRHHITDKKNKIRSLKP